MKEKMFEHYDNPGKAERVFRDYISDISSSFTMKLIYDAVRENKFAEDLDIVLDGILTGHSLINFGGGSPNYDSDEDCNGGWSNVVRALEE